jgi:hypothetical protein
MRAKIYTHFHGQGEFSRALKSVGVRSRKSWVEIIKKGMILMLQAGRSATPLGHKNRKIMMQGFDSVSTESDSFEGLSRALDTVGRQFFPVWHQHRSEPYKQFIPRVRNLKNDTPENAAARAAREGIIAEFKTITYRGTAKKSWGWALWKACGTHRENMPARPMARDPIDVTKHFAAMAPWIMVENKLDWIRKIVPNIEQICLTSATHRLEKEAQRDLKKAVAA